MNALSLEAINRQTPYKVAESEEPNYFEFFTKYDVHYSVGFMADEDLMQSEAYHLIIINVDNRRSPNDLGVKETVLAIIEEFFNQNVASLLYICETGDGKQSFRSKLFERWFYTYNKKAYYTFITSSIVDEEGVVNYATIIIRNDNPNLPTAVAEFTNTIQILSQKPE